MNEEYRVEATQFGSLTRYQTSAYCELSVVNMTNENVVLIDVENNHQVVPGVGSGVHNQVISIFKRSGVSNSLTSDGNQVAIPGTKIDVEKFRLRNGPVYIKEINMLLCTEEQAITAKHPYAQVTYEEGLQYAIDSISRSITDEAPSFRLLANDPTGSYEYLWTILDSEVVSIPVTHNNSDKFTFTIVTIRDGKFYTDSLDLSELLNGTTNIVKFPNKLVPWVTTSNLNAKELAKTFKWITPELLEEYKSRLIAENKKALDANKATMDAKANEYAASIMNLKSELSQAQTERDEYKLRYSSFKNDSVTNLDQLKNYYAMMQLRNDYGISNNNLMLANWKQQSAEKENNWKIWGLIAAATLPVVGLMAMKIFESSMKKS